MTTLTRNTEAQNDKFRQSTLSNPEPGKALYLRPEIKCLPETQKDMIKTRVHNYQFSEGVDSDHTQATFDFFGKKYFFFIDEDPTLRIIIGMVY